MKMKSNTRRAVLIALAAAALTFFGGDTILAVLRPIVDIYQLYAPAV